MMKIIQTQLKDMPSSFLAALGCYRYNVFARGEGWSIPSRLRTPGQEYDRYDRSDVSWLIAWSAQYGIIGCARLMKWQPVDVSESIMVPFDLNTTSEMSRFSARLEIDQELPLCILWHVLNKAQQCGMTDVISAATPMLEKLFEQNRICYQPLTPGLLHTEDNLFSVRIPVKQPVLAEKYHGTRCYSPEEVLPSLGGAVNLHTQAG